MQERLSFYIPRDSPLHRLNPLTKLALAFSLVFLAFFSPWYWTGLAVLVGIILPLVSAGKVLGPYLAVALRIMLPAAGFIFAMQSLFLPGGQDVLLRLWFVEVTRESVASAFLNATRITTMVSSFTVFLLTTHPSQLMSDLTRRKLPGTFSYVIISTLQIIPQMQAKARTIMDAQRARGLDTESSFRRRVGALVPLVGPLVFGSLVEVEERAIAIEARGFTAPHAKTSLHEIPDTQTDRVIRWALLGLVLITLASKIWLS